MYYSDNKKTLEYEDDIIAILSAFDVATKQIALLVSYKILVKWVCLHCTIAVALLKV